MTHGLRERARKAVADTLESTPLTGEAKEFVVLAGTYNRPVLAQAVCELINPSSVVLMPVLASIELLHKASVIHDDIQDGDAWRRGAPTAHIRFGIGGALCLADILLSTAFRALRPIELSDYLADAIDLYSDMAAGQWIDIYGASELPISFTDSAAKKSGTLVGCAFKWGARMAGAHSDKINAWHEAGSQLGLAFQVLNDIDNLLGKEDRGNAAGNDISQARHNAITMQIAQGMSRVDLSTALREARLAATDSITRARVALAPVASADTIEILVTNTIGVSNLEWLEVQQL